MVRELYYIFKEVIFWQNIKRLNGYGKLTGDGNGEKKGKN